MILNRPRLVALTSLLAPCGGEPFPPPAGTLIGTFGGPQIGLSFGARVVYATQICSATYFNGPKRTLTRGRKGDFSGYACALTQP